MKHSSFACLTLSLLLLAAVQAPLPASAAKLVHAINSKNPIPEVVELLTQLKGRVEADGRAEQASYDKYACWCEETMGQKVKDIAEAKDQIEKLNAMIVKTKAAIGAHTAEIQQAKKDMAANFDSRREASEVREKEAAGYADEKMESEQCTGALEAAIKVLTGAGSKKGFLETLQEARLLSVVGGVRSVLARPRASQAASASDLDVVRRFVEKPENFVGSASAEGGVSAAQVGNNPFGDYAPQSTQIQGILKGMYDTFVGDLEKANAAEAEAQKAFEALMATKQTEYNTLQATLRQHELDFAEKSKALAESREVLDATKSQLEADEAFFAATKSSCQAAAGEWSERARLRTTELNGIAKCISILTAPEAQEVFERAHANNYSAASFLQLASEGRAPAGARPAGKERLAAFTAVKSIAAKFKNVRLAQIALQLKTGGHFDKVMASIDAMVELLRKEEQADIEHRDRCQGAENKNTNDMEDLTHSISKAEADIGRIEGDIGTLTTEIDTLAEDINKTKTERQERLDLRNQEVASFRQAMEDDTQAVALIESAIQAMSAFYRDNNIPLALRAKKAANYTVDPDKAPELSWAGKDFTSRNSESGGLVAILEMVKEDLQKEMQTARADDAKAQAAYKAEDAAMKETLNKQRALKLAKDRELGDLKGEKVDTEDHKAAKEADHLAETQLKDAIYSDCSWVATHFESRREKRKAEMSGLQEAKSYLAGVESGEEV